MSTTTEPVSLAGSLSNANSDPTCLPASLYLTNGDRAGESCGMESVIRYSAFGGPGGEYHHPGLNRVSQHETNFFLHSADLWSAPRKLSTKKSVVLCQIYHGPYPSNEGTQRVASAQCGEIKRSNFNCMECRPLGAFHFEKGNE